MAASALRAGSSYLSGVLPVQQRRLHAGPAPGLRKHALPSLRSCALPTAQCVEVPVLRAGDSQCGALPAAADAARRAGAAQALASDRHMTPTSSAASTASAVHLRQGGFSDDSLR